MQKIIDDHPTWKLLSKAKLIKKVRDVYDIPVKDIEAYYNARELNQVYSTTPFKRKKQLVITAPPYSYQIDVIHMPAYKKYNDGIDKFLLIVDILSRKAFMYTLKSNRMSDVLDAYEKFIMDTDFTVNSISGDNFFKNDQFIAFNDELMIKVYTDVAKDDHITKQGDKLAIVDRAARTIKQMINKYIDENNTLKWTQFLPEILEEYNDAPHSGLRGMSPNDVYDDIQYMKGLHEAQIKKNAKIMKSYDIEEGDLVRTVEGKGIFEKEKPKFSKSVHEVVGREGNRFVLHAERRKYRPTELKKIGEVSDKITNNVREQAKARHRKVTNVVRDVGLSYEDADRSVSAHSGKKPIPGRQSHGDRQMRSGIVN